MRRRERGGEVLKLAGETDLMLEYRLDARYGGERGLQVGWNHRTGEVTEGQRGERSGTAKGKVVQCCAEQFRGDLGQDRSVGKLAVEIRRGRNGRGQARETSGLCQRDGQRAEPMNPAGPTAVGDAVANRVKLIEQCHSIPPYSETLANRKESGTANAGMGAGIDIPSDVDLQAADH